MKKVCIICLFVLAMFGIYYFSYNYSIKYFAEDNSDYNLTDIPTQAVDANKEAIISNVTQFIVEYYNADDKSMTEQVIETPIEYLGYTRDKLIDAMTKYEGSPSVTDKAKGLVSYQLVSFDSSNVTVRKSFSSLNMPQVYYVFVENSYLTIYLEDKTTLYDYTNIKITTLPEYIQKEVVNGLKIESQKALYEFLETYTS